jgi:hypothetical protein
MRMQSVLDIFLIDCLSPDIKSPAATKPHVISLGKWTTIKWLTGPDDRASGHASQISLLEFDPYSSAAIWYRD